jgi:transcriptional regulator with XRE-family HTH domain
MTNLQAAREARGLRIADLACQVGIDPELIRQAEARGGSFDSITIRLLAKALDIYPSSLLLKEAPAEDSFSGKLWEGPEYQGTGVGPEGAHDVREHIHGAGAPVRSKQRVAKTSFRNVIFGRQDFSAPLPWGPETRRVKKSASGAPSLAAVLFGSSRPSSPRG